MNTLKISLNLLLASSGLSAQPSRPNIVIILADDLGWADVGFHGSPIQTPHLDSLAGEGIQLNRFYTAPISSPTRAGLMTGRYPGRLGIRTAVIPPWRDFGLDPEEELLPEMLEKAGYPNRAIIGKWHLGHSRKAYHPMSNGFTHFYGHLNGAIDYFSHEREQQLDWHNDWESSYDRGYSTDLITDEAVTCIDRYRDAPFFLYVAYNAPHTPLQAKPEDIALYTGDIESLSEKEKKQVLYAAMVTCMDKGVGKIREALRNNGIDQNTLVIFFSDNGAEPGGGGSNLPLKGHKFQEWDGGLRVPAVISFPAQFRRSCQIGQITGFVDIVPTIRAMLGIETEPHRPLDGIDIAPVLTGAQQQIKRDFYLGCGATVNQNYKLILPGKNESMNIQSAVLLYYPSDPWETVNVITGHPQEAARLQNVTEKFDAMEPDLKVAPFNEGRKGFIAPHEWKIEKD
ncbi:MAG: sulfatase-like hydrolase/transferase [Tannerella sp.]|jgi:arylsulfatase B|nr:sulfatase-like hydrolase/transferase [Tannerella sp.]